MDEFKNLEEIINAVARLKKPHDTAYAAADLLMKCSEHTDDALRQWDELENIINAIKDGRLVYVTQEVRKAG